MISDTVHVSSRTVAVKESKKGNICYYLYLLLDGNSYKRYLKKL